MWATGDKSLPFMKKDPGLVKAQPSEVYLWLRIGKPLEPMGGFSSQRQAG